MFTCPHCSLEFSLPDYLTHANVCTAPKDDVINLSNDDSPISNNEEHPANEQSNVSSPNNNFKCPWCSQDFSMAGYAAHALNCRVVYRGANGGANAGGSSVQNQVEQIIEPQPPSVNHEVVMNQQPQPPMTAIMNPYPGILSMNNGVNGNGENISNAHRQPAQFGNGLLARQQTMGGNQTPFVQPLTTSTRDSTPMEQNNRGLSRSANPMQPQYANSNPQIFAMPMNQTPMQIDPILQPRRLNEELFNGYGNGAPANAAVSADANGANGVPVILPEDLQGTINTMVNMTFQRVARQLGNEINDIRRRVERTEALMMIKLGNIEIALNNLKKDPQ